MNFSGIFWIAYLDLDLLFCKLGMILVALILHFNCLLDLVWIKRNSFKGKINVHNLYFDTVK